VSRDITTPLSRTDCRPLAGTSYNQPVHQIWILYVYSLRRYERRRYNTGVWRTHTHRRTRWRHIPRLAWRRTVKIVEYWSFIINPHSSN